MVGGSQRYQLLTALTGTALQASRDGASRAALIIHEFQGPRTREALLERNASDLEAFLQNLNGGRPVSLAQGRFVGPWKIRVGSAPGSDIEVLMAKVVTDLHQEGKHS